MHFHMMDIFFRGFASHAFRRDEAAASTLHGSKSRKL
jgi:hypothetical protein